MSRTYIQEIPPIDIVGLPETQVARDAQYQTESTLDFDEKWENAQRMAAGASVVGSTLQMIPTPWTIGLGMMLQVPDLAFDIYTAKEAYRNGQDPTSAMSSLAFDAAGMLPGYASLVGVPDDVSSAVTGKNLYDNLQGTEEKSPTKSKKPTTVAGIPTKEYWETLRKLYSQHEQPYFSGKGPLAPNSTTYYKGYPTFLSNVYPWQQGANLPQGVVGTAPYYWNRPIAIHRSAVATADSLKTTRKKMAEEAEAKKAKTKHAEGGPVRRKGDYVYADSNTTDPAFINLTPIGEGVYRNQFGKIVYDTEKVTPPERLRARGVVGYAEGGPLKKSYKDFSTRLSKAWNNQDISKDDYDYQKYYNDNPTEAYRQLKAIEQGSKAHFPDGGKSGTYKKPSHPTYPDLGVNSWLNNDKVFNMSTRQAVPENTDRVLDYLGSDLYYNNGNTKAMYNGAYQLPSITITPKGNYTELIPNELGTGWMYSDRAGRYQDLNYDYLRKYLNSLKINGK